jgi:hypothetical protein
MFNTPEILILSTAIILMLLIIIVLFISVHSLTKQVKLSEINISSNELLVNQLQTLFIELELAFKEKSEQQRTESIELNQVTKQLEVRIKNIQNEIVKLQQTQTQLPEDKLYSRAFKMVDLGADAEELVRECDIPRAEAEMLISIHQKQNTS